MIESLVRDHVAFDEFSQKATVKTIAAGRTRPSESGMEPDSEQARSYRELESLYAQAIARAEAAEASVKDWVQRDIAFAEKAEFIRNCIHELKKRFATAESERDRWKQQWFEETNLRRKLRNELASAQARMEELTAELQSAVERHHTECAFLQDRLAKTERERNESEAQCRLLQDQLSGMRIERDKALACVAEAERERERPQTLYEEAADGLVTEARHHPTTHSKRLNLRLSKDYVLSMGQIYRWAVGASHGGENHAGEMRRRSRRRLGVDRWTDDDIARFEARWPVGTRERLAMALLLFTGLRRGDIVRLGPQHIRDGFIRLRTERTNTPVTIPVLPELKRVIDASPTDDPTFLARRDGRPMSKEVFESWFKAACEAANVSASAVGLHARGAAIAANAGATVLLVE